MTEHKKDADGFEECVNGHEGCLEFRRELWGWLKDNVGDGSIRTYLIEKQDTPWESIECFMNGLLMTAQSGDEQKALLAAVVMGCFLRDRLQGRKERAATESDELQRMLGMVNDATTRRLSAMVPPATSHE